MRALVTILKKNAKQTQLPGATNTHTNTKPDQVPAVDKVLSGEDAFAFGEEIVAATNMHAHNAREFAPHKPGRQLSPQNLGHPGGQIRNMFRQIKIKKLKIKK